MTEQEKIDKLIKNALAIIEVHTLPNGPENLSNAIGIAQAYAQVAIVLSIKELNKNLEQVILGRENARIL